MSAPTGRFLLWDLPTRLFHWLLVLLLVFQWGTAEWHWLDMRWHFYGGYAILALLLFRLAWGFVGSDSARFARFVRGPRAVLGYLRNVTKREPEYLAGHNPVGGWSVLALIACVLVQAVTGLFAGDDDDFLYGPLAGWLGSGAMDAVTDVHEGTKNVLLALAAVHVLGVLWHLVVKRENLVAAMLGGRAALREDPRLKFAGLGLAIVLAGISVAAVWALVTYASK
jgi:cytochrome b